MKSIQVSKKFRVKSEELWRVISAKENLNLYHPFCKSNVALNWPGKDSIDELTYLNGRTYRREFFNWEEGKGYDLLISYGKIKSSVKWEITSLSNGSQLTIKLNPQFKLSNNKILNKILSKLFIPLLLKSYLKHVLKGLSFYLLNDKNVKPNQFGKHIWFS